jgi:CRP-like cAMP-binding protein
MSQFDIKMIADTMYPKTFEKDENIITYGDLGQEYFILEQGEVEILVYKEGTDPKDPNLN